MARVLIHIKEKQGIEELIEKEFSKVLHFFPEKYNIQEWFFSR